MTYEEAMANLRSVILRNREHIDAITKKRHDPKVPGSREALTEYLTAYNACVPLVNARAKENQEKARAQGADRSKLYFAHADVISIFKGKVADFKREARKLQHALEKLTAPPKEKKTKLPITWTFETKTVHYKAGWQSRGDSDETCEAMTLYIPVAHAECNGKHMYFYCKGQSLKHLGARFMYGEDLLPDEVQHRPSSLFEETQWNPSQHIGKIKAENWIRKMAERS